MILFDVIQGIAHTCGVINFECVDFSKFLLDIAYNSHVGILIYFKGNGQKELVPLLRRLFQLR